MVVTGNGATLEGEDAEQVLAKPASTREALIQ